MQSFIHRRDSSMPWQTWNAFPPEAIVQVKNALGESKIDLAKNLWWGMEYWAGMAAENVIMQARRLDRPKGQENATISDTYRGAKDHAARSGSGPLRYPQH